MQQNNMNPNAGMIQPRAGVSVSVPGAGSMNTPGMAARTGVNPMTGMVADPMAQYRQWAESGGTTAGGGNAGGIKWESYGAGGLFDQGMQEILSSAGPDQDSLQYHASQIAPVNVVFIQHLISGTGQFYEVYRQSVEGFRRNEIGNPCPVRDAFITMFVRHQEFRRPVAINASSMFGWRLINVRMETGKEDLTRNQYLAAAEIAVRSTLFMEMVGWMMKTQEGQVHARSLPSDLAAKMPNLSKYNEVLNTACATFGINNPYANLTFEVKAAVRNDLQTNRYESGAAYLYGHAGAPEGRMDFEGGNDLFSMIQKNARDFRGEQHHQPVHHDTTNNLFNNEDHHWNKIRNDLSNLTPKNKGEFQLNRFFYNIGKPKHYLVPESDWKQIKHAFVKHAEMKQEQTVIENTFRIVIIDLEADSGWFSTIVRSEDYDMPTLLTDPTKLLPLLEDTGADYLTVKDSDLASIADKKTMTIPVEECIKLEEAGVIPLVTSKEKIVTNSSKELEATLLNVNQRVAKNFSDVNAVSFHAHVWDTFACERAEDKVRLFQDMPFLFKDSDMKTRPSMFTACKELLKYFKQNIVGKELMTFIDTRLTTAINDYFINGGGYDSIPTDPGFLNVDSLVRDYEELDHHLERTDPLMWKLFNQNDKDHELTQALKMFTFNNPFVADQENMSVIEKIKQEQELVLERPLHITFINNRGGPIYKDTDRPIHLKRSTFPEYFDLVEKGFEPTMGDLPFDATDKIVSFTTSDNLWLFTYSGIDKNIATLRHISRRNPLVMLALD